jgi:TBCC domain-containing protein 1
MHAGWYNDNAHCAGYLLRHLRKMLLLVAVSHNAVAVRAIMHLSAIQQHDPEKMRRYSTGDDIRRQHEEEHGNVGLNVHLTMDDLERLHFWLQPPSGGGVDDPPIKMGDFLWNHIYSTPPPVDATIPLGEVEREIRRHLELELLISHDHDDKDDASEEDAATALSNLSLDENSEKTQRAKQPQQGYQKELTYSQLRGTTILLKPNSHYSEVGHSSGASIASGEQNVGPLAHTGRLHDLAITDCSDVHMYLLQPFEHVTIAGCTGCTIVVGAVAGLLQIVDTEKTTITSAARRILVSNSCDVLHCVFTPSPPLLVGDYRNCQFAPYNTYYEGLREDLLATGMAAAVVPENQSPYHGSRSVDDAAWPPLQCASNKWKQPVELSKLEIPQVAPPVGASPGVSTGSVTGTSPGADDKATPDATMMTPVLLPASDFNVLFVLIESEFARQRRLEAEEQAAHTSNGEEPPPQESLYCRLLAEVLQLSPFHLPLEYERHALVKADRIRSIKETAHNNLTQEQQLRFEDELNRGFRDWLVTSGNLRQVLDLVHMEKRAGA